MSMPGDEGAVGRRSRVRLPRRTGQARLGPLLRKALDEIGHPGPVHGITRRSVTRGPREMAVLPLSLSIPRIRPEPGEGWRHYKERAMNLMGPVIEWLESNAGMRCRPAFAGNALESHAAPEQIAEATRNPSLETLELDPPRMVTLMDDAIADIELPHFSARRPGVDGSGVRVAVLDSGIDLRHPWLQVAESTDTCDESVEIPGRHGTHVAGILASRHEGLPGVAPGVDLLNIKVLTAAGVGQASFITRGVDAALDRGARVLCMSVGFNHLPTWSDRGHGWACPDGRCPLCTAVDNAALVDGVLAVVAAGNEHQKAEFLRSKGFGDSFDTEITCPGAAREAISVGAITKQTFLTAPFSSRGPTAWGGAKPDIAAPGVNVSSTVPLPRDPSGRPAGAGIPADFCAPDSGTSMATPMVAGVVALILQRRREAGLPVSVADVRAELLGRGFKHVASPPFEVGVGRLNLGGL